MVWSKAQARAKASAIKFLQGIRESDGIVFVLRAFGDPDVPGPTDPLENLGVVEIELALADLDSAERQLDKRRRQAKGDQDGQGRRRVARGSRGVRSPKASRSIAAA